MRRSQPASQDSEDADTVATADCSRWRNGVERQARPDAHAHQVAAGKASGAKRKQRAMTKCSPTGGICPPAGPYRKTSFGEPVTVKNLAPANLWPSVGRKLTGNSR